MKKTSFALLLIALALSLVPAATGAETVQNVLDKLIAAQGGREALAAIKDSTFTGNAEMVTFGMNGTFTMTQKEPDKMRLDMEMMGVVITQSYDGETAWQVDPQTGNDVVMTEQQATEFKRQALGNDALLNPSKYGITFELKPPEKIENKDYLVLDQVFKDGFRNTIYLDPQTYLIYKTKTKSTTPAGTELNSETVMSDYQKEGNLTVAKSMTIYQEGQEFMRLKISKAVFNSGVEDQFFKRTGK